VWETATQILFSGDIVYDGPLIDNLYHSNLDDYQISMERLLRLPVRVVHGGHFASYDGQRHQEIIRAWLDNAQSSQ
jgi:glyoxylase-like metal-dependent hydrolase (beta-lactamase superfamily II)